MQCDPSSYLDIRRETEHIEQGPGMTMIGIDEGQAEFIARSQLTDEIRFPFRVHPYRRGEIRDQFGNLKANRPRLVDAAMRAGVDCLHHNAVTACMLTMDGSSDDGCRETGQSSYLDDVPRR